MIEKYRVNYLNIRKCIEFSFIKTNIIRKYISGVIK